MPRNLRFTDVTKTSLYRLTKEWMQKHRKEVTPEQQEAMKGFFQCVEEYQAAKQKLFEADFRGQLPLVTKELIGDIGKKYDELLSFYEKNYEKLPDEFVCFTRKDHSNAIISHAFCDWAGRLIKRLRKEDERSVEFLRKWLNRGNRCLLDLADIRDFGDLDPDQPSLYPFYNEGRYDLEKSEWNSGWKAYTAVCLQFSFKENFQAESDRFERTRKRKGETRSKLFNVPDAARSKIKQKAIDFFFAEHKQAKGPNLPAKERKKARPGTQSLFSTMGQPRKKMPEKPNAVKSSRDKYLKRRLTRPQSGEASPKAGVSIPKKYSAAQILPKPQKKKLQNRCNKEIPICAKAKLSRTELPTGRTLGSNRYSLDSITEEPELFCERFQEKREELKAVSNAIHLPLGKEGRVKSLNSVTKGRDVKINAPERGKQRGANVQKVNKAQKKVTENLTRGVCRKKVSLSRTNMAPSNLNVRNKSQLRKTITQKLAVVKLSRDNFLNWRFSQTQGNASKANAPILKKYDTAFYNPKQNDSQNGYHAVIPVRAKTKRH